MTSMAAPKRSGLAVPTAERGTELCLQQGCTNPRDLRQGRRVCRECWNELRRVRRAKASGTNGTARPKVDAELLGRDELARGLAENVRRLWARGTPNIGDALEAAARYGGLSTGELGDQPLELRAAAAAALVPDVAGVEGMILLMAQRRADVDAGDGDAGDGDGDG